MYAYENNNVSFFLGGSNNCHPAMTVNIATVANEIKHNQKLAEIVYNVRKFKKLGKKAYSDEKNRLPYITTSGVFSYRNNNSLIQNTYTYIGALDVDLNEKEELNVDVDFPALKQSLTEDPSVILVCDSPGGYIKAWVALKVGEHKPKDHYELMKQVIIPHYTNQYGCIFDQRQAVLSQPFFLSSDPNAYIEFDVKPVELDYTIKKHQGKFEPNFFGKTINSPFPDEYVQFKINEIYELKQGEIWNKLGGISFNLGNLSGDGRIIIDPNIILSKIINAINAAKNITNKNLQIKNAKNSFLNGYNKKY